MKVKFTQNIGLKIISVVAAFFLWLIVVNVDDPVITKTYTGIPVEILNADAITQEGKCFEVLGGTDSITVVLSAKRSVLDDMSRDYIKATADMKEYTFLDTVPIYVKATRYADKIESITTRTESMKVSMENLVNHTVPLSVRTEGSPLDGFILSSALPKVTTLNISGPESKVNNVFSAVADLSVEGLSADESFMVPITLLDADGGKINDTRLTPEITSVSVNVVIWGTKEIPITCTASGVPADGYSATGTIITDPASVVITGRSAYLDSMASINIPGDLISIAGASENVEKTVNLKTLLPSGISFAEDDFGDMVEVVVEIEPNDRKAITIPVSNITVENVPEGYTATIVDIGSLVTAEIQGKGDAFDRFDGSLAIGKIDASKLVARSAQGSESFPTGDCDGKVEFTFPMGVTEVSPVFMEVIIERLPGTTQ